MKTGKEMIEYVSNLSKLYLTDEEKITTHRDMDRMLKFFDIMDEIDTDNIKPLTHLLDEYNMMREDNVIIYDREQLLELAPDRVDEYYVVPRTV